VLNYKHQLESKGEQYFTAMDVTVVDYLNSLDTRDTFTVFGYGHSNDGEHIANFKLGHVYLLCLDEADEIDFEGYYFAKSSDYFISNSDGKWAEYDTLNDLLDLGHEDHLPLQKVKKSFKGDLQNRADDLSQFECRNLGDELFVFDSIYNWYAVTGEKNELIMIGNFPDHRSIRREGIYYSICKDYDDFDFYPDSLITEDFKVVQFPRGIIYQIILDNGLVLVLDTEKHQGHYVESLYNPFSMKFVLDWYKEIVVLPGKKLRITTIDGDQETIDFPELIK
jgi:hypothetical protein